VNDFFLLQEAQGVEDLHCKYADHIFSETVVAVGHEKFIEIAVEQFEEHALSSNIVYDVVAEDGEIFDAYHSAEVVFVSLSDLGEDGNFKEGLLDEFLVAFGNLQSEVLFGLVVEDLDHFSE
jgi:hypothetical protein